MTFNNNNFSSNNNGLGLPGVGYASRGKATGLKRLSVASPPKLGALNENQVDDAPTPLRTSRSYLLAGLRTAPKTPSGPVSAPYNQTQHNVGLDNSRYTYQNVNNNVSRNHAVPHTSIGNNFPMHQYGVVPGQQFYALPEQVLAPPSLEIDEHEDPQMLADMYQKQQMLAYRQQVLQQQLANLTGQFPGLNLNNGQRHAQQMYPQTPVTPQQMSMYNQQLLQGVQPVVQEFPGHPGVYLVYNPLTGQTTYATDLNAQKQPQLANSPPPPTPSHSVTGFGMDTPSFRAQVSPPIDADSVYPARSFSPPKKTPSPPGDVEPLPPPSANAFRRGHHKKVSSLALNNITPVGDGPKSAYLPRTVGIPPTPLTGTFGPGQGRAGEHPMRQPRGPPAMEELKEKPTTKFAGSKNFATRQRRQALSSLVRAGLERRVRPGSGSNGSMTPVSETELTFSVPSDNESDSGRSLGGKQSIGSLRAAANGAIGSERKASQERMSPVSSGSEDGKSSEQRRTRTPLLALANAAEKRKSVVY